MPRSMEGDGTFLVKFAYIQWWTEESLRGEINRNFKMALPVTVRLEIECID